MVVFLKIWRVLFSCNNCFEIDPLALFTDEMSVKFAKFFSQIISVGHFWATYADQETRLLMDQLHVKINCLGGRNLKILDREDIKIGTYCLALFEDEFFRAEIISTSQFHVKVCFL